MVVVVVGTGYVGLSVAVLLSTEYQVIAVDILKNKVDMINQRVSPIQDLEIETFLKEKQLKLSATLDSVYTRIVI